MQIVFERNLNSLVAKSFFFASELLFLPFSSSFRNKNNKTFLLLLVNPLSFQLSNHLNLFCLSKVWKLKVLISLTFQVSFFSSLDFPTHHLKRNLFCEQFLQRGTGLKKVRHHRGDGDKYQLWGGRRGDRSTYFHTSFSFYKKVVKTQWRAIKKAFIKPLWGRSHCFMNDLIFIN